MTLLLTMLPLYVFGNLHCFGMCGPLVMMIGQHRYRYFYFAGRLTSFTLTGMLAGEAGAVLQVILRYYHLSVLTSFIFGSLILIIALSTLIGYQYPGYDFLARRLAKVNHTLSLLMLKDQPWPAFLFGFFTVALPCGQTLIVFSACALAGDLWIGFINGFAFALLTSPSLFAAMYAHRFFSKLKRYYSTIIGIFGLMVGVLAICRGLAETDRIPHLILNPHADSKYHLIIY
jgi:uncharacterized protein